ncbi:MAG: hypothetical protein RLZZ546_2943 [Bacteroidota bacterium]|jgi:hypothetical protein
MNTIVDPVDTIQDQLINNQSKDRLSLIEFLSLLHDTMGYMVAHNKISITLNSKTLIKLTLGPLDFLSPDKVIFPKPRFKEDISDLLLKNINLNKDFFNGYYYLNQELGSHKTFADFIHHSLYLQDNNNLFENHWALTKDMYDKYKNIMSEYMTIFSYKTEHNHHSLFSIPHDLSKSDLIENIEYLNEELTLGLSFFQKEIDKFAHKLNINYNSLYLEIKEDWDQLKIKYTSLKAEFKNTPSKPSFSLLNKAQNDAFVVWQKLVSTIRQIFQKISHLDSMLNISTAINSYADMDESILKINYLLADWKTLSITNINQKLERLNIVNHNQHEAEVVLQGIREKIDHFNSLKIIKKRIEFNSNNYFQICKDLTNSRDLLNAVGSYLSKEDNELKTRNFYSKLTHDEKLFITKLESLPITTWQEAFETSSSKKLIPFYFHPLTVQSQHNALSLIESNKEITSTFIDLCVDKISYFTIKNLGTNKDLLKKINLLLDSDNNVLELYKFTEEEKSLIQNSRPIEILTNESLEDDYLQYKLNFQNKSLSFKLENYSPSALDQITQPMEAIHVTERYHFASLLAKEFIVYVSDFKLLQLKNANIICLYPDQIYNSLLSSLDEFGVKEINLKNDKINNVIESLLETNRKRILLTINGLLNYKMPETFEMQYEIIGAFKRLGFSIHNLWSVELIDKKEKLIDSVITVCSRN